MSDIYTPLWKTFVAISTIAVASAIYALIDASGFMPTFQAGWTHYVQLALPSALLVTIGAGYLGLRRSMARHIDEQRVQMAGASRDSLTGALNRAVFLGRMREALRGRGTAQLGYLHIDMDNLKVLNDTFGHKAGDRALTSLVGAIAHVAPTATIGRLGGDEFAVFLEDSASKKQSACIAQEIVERLGGANLIDGQHVPLSASIGVAQAPCDGSNVEMLIANADLALYAGKTSGRRKIVCFEPDMMIDEQHKRFIERELRGAILTGEIALHYQPVLRADSGQISSYEALVRWNHSTRGMIGPDKFIPIAERSTLIDLLGDWVLERACKDLPALGTQTVSINISAAQLRRPDFAVRFLRTVRRLGVTSDRLVVEITETSQFEANKTEIQNIRALKDAGVKIAIDDFGAGHTSLQYLRHVPFDYLKIDKCYSQNLDSDPVNQALVSAICGIGRSLNAMIVAEGVETEAQRVLLRASGCTHMQGFLFGRPMPLRAIRAHEATHTAA